jgi:hypothetical protein
MNNKAKPYDITKYPPVPVKFQFMARQPGFKEMTKVVGKIVQEVLWIPDGDKAAQPGIETLASNVASASRYCINEQELTSFIKVNLEYYEKESAEIASGINKIRASHHLLKPICDSDYKDVVGFYGQAADFLVEVGFWEMKDGSIDSWDLEWDLEFYPILWRARYVHSYDEFFDLYQTLCTLWLGVNHGMINKRYDPEKIWKNIDTWKNITWAVKP